MDDTQLKSQIDSQITSQTDVDSISPTIVGENMKAIIDLSVQETRLKIVKTIIPTASVLQLFTTPVTILDSTEAGKIKFPISVYVKRLTGNAYALATSSFSVINDFGTALSANLNPNPLISTPEGYFQSAISLYQNNSGGSKNALYKLKANSGDPTLGTGDLEVYTTYIEIIE